MEWPSSTPYTSSIIRYAYVNVNINVKPTQSSTGASSSRSVRIPPENCDDTNFTVTDDIENCPNDNTCGTASDHWVDNIILRDNRSENIAWKLLIYHGHDDKIFRENTTSIWEFFCIDRRTLQWRYNERDGVSNHQPHDLYHQPHDWLLKRLFGCRSKKTSKLRVTGLCEGNSPVTGDFPHTGPVTRKMFPFDDVIMRRNDFLKLRMAKSGHSKYMSEHQLQNVQNLTI